MRRGRISEGRHPPERSVRWGKAAPAASAPAASALLEQDAGRQDPHHQAGGSGWAQRALAVGWRGAVLPRGGHAGGGQWDFTAETAGVREEVLGLLKTWASGFQTVRVLVGLVAA